MKKISALLIAALLTCTYSSFAQTASRVKGDVKDESQNIKGAVLGGLYHLKKRKVDRMLTDLMNQMKDEKDATNQDILMGRYVQVKNVERTISKFLGSVIVK